jgi:hypothetical protein
METRQKKPEIGFLRIDGKQLWWYNHKVISKTLMTDGTVEHHME